MWNANEENLKQQGHYGPPKSAEVKDSSISSLQRSDFISCACELSAALNISQNFLQIRGVQMKNMRKPKK